MDKLRELFIWIGSSGVPWSWASPSGVPCEFEIAATLRQSLFDVLMFRTTEGFSSLGFGHSMCLAMLST